MDMLAFPDIKMRRNSKKNLTASLCWGGPCRPNFQLCRVLGRHVANMSGAMKEEDDVNDKNGVVVINDPLLEDDIKRVRITTMMGDAVIPPTCQQHSQLRQQ